MPRLLLPLIALLSFLPLGAADSKIGYVYSDQIMRDYQGMSESNTALAREKANFRQHADSLYQVLTTAKLDFEKEKLALSDEARAAKAAGIDELQRKYDAYLSEVYGPNGKLEQKHTELLAPVLQKIKDAVAKIASTGGYSIVFDAAESRLAILYAVASANLTNEVIEELNREYKPVTTAEQDRRYAVLPLYEANDEASQANLGDQCRALIFRRIDDQPRTQMIAGADVDAALTNRGQSARANLTAEAVYQIGSELQADYVIYGSVSRTGKRTTVTLFAADPRLGKSFPQETSTANRPEELNTVVGNLALQVLQKLLRQ